MVRNRVAKVSELTPGGFIRESTSQLRAGRMVETVELLDPYPDCYKVYTKSVTVRKRNRPQDKAHMEWLIARPFDGHMPRGGYDVLGPNGAPMHFDSFAQAKDFVDTAAEEYTELMTTTQDMMAEVSKPVAFGALTRR